MVSSIDVAWIDRSFDGTAVGVIKYPFMQLYYFIQFLYMQLPCMTDYEYSIQYAHGFAWLIGLLCIVAFMICVACRVFYGPDAADCAPGRMFVLFGEILQCMVHRPLWWYAEKRIQALAERETEEF